MYCQNEPSAYFHALHHAHRRRAMEEQAARGLADLGAPMLLLVLLQGESQGKCYSQREVARQMRLSPATVAVSLKSMERSGYVIRSTDERDQRRNRVVLTDKGREAVERCGEALRAVDRRMLSDFTQEEKEQLNGFFARMLKNLGGEEPSPFLPVKGV